MKRRGNKKDAAATIAEPRRRTGFDGGGNGRRGLVGQDEDGIDLTSQRKNSVHSSVASCAFIIFNEMSCRLE